MWLDMIIGPSHPRFPVPGGDAQGSSHMTKIKLCLLF
jgi:hypothetical protein